MKKSIVAVGVLIVLGGAWVGGAWYTGKMIQDQVNKSIVDAQTYIDKNAPEYQAKLSVADYQRGIFSSTINYQFEMVDQTNEQGPQKDSVTIHQEVSHGPFPLAKFSLIPKLAYSKTELVKQDSLNELFEMAGGKSPLTVDILTSYSGSSDLKLVLEPLTGKDSNTFKFSGLTVDGVAKVLKGEEAVTLTSSPFELNDEGRIVSYDTAKIDVTQNKAQEYQATASVGKFTIAETDADQLVMNGLTIKSNGKIGKFDLGVGVSDIELKNVTYTVKQQPKLTIDNLLISSNAQETDKFVNQVVDTTIGQMSIEGKIIGSGSLKLKLDQFDGKALQYLNQNSNQLTYLFLGIPAEESAEQAGNMMMNNLMAFLDANPVISIAPFVWKNDKGESQIDMSLTMMKPDPQNMAMEDMSQLLMSSIKSFSSNSKLSIPMLNEQVKINHEISDGLSAEEAQAQATESVQQMVSLGLAQKMISKLDDNTITSSFNYADGVIDLNGQKMPAEQFINLFMMSGME
ncbi:YdgA family protein [Limnobaculum xujianqingii]|uniref:YdgA family protein n=1 Tax=Limnobaculum xujianqingii TaxID=2738837 RepID=UPI00112A9735|nr:YdgA family protein [Limnobaculum xujianqingii]